MVCWLPVLGDVEAPLELEMRLLVVIDEARIGGVVATGKHAAGGLLLGDWFLGLACDVWSALTRTKR